MAFSAASATKKILMMISNSPHPVSVTSNGGRSIAVPEQSQPNWIVISRFAGSLRNGVGYVSWSLKVTFLMK